MTTVVADAGVGVLRAGFLGAGFMARVQTRAVRFLGATLTGNASSTPERATRAAAALGVERPEHDAAALVAARDVHVVHVCTPDAMHAELTLAAIAAGKHVVCEKPLATSVADARAVAAAVWQMAPGRKNALTLELHGTSRNLRFTQERPEKLWLGARAGSQLLLRDPDVDSPDSARVQSGQTPSGLPTFRDGLRAAVLTDAVLASSASGEWIEAGQ